MDVSVISQIKTKKFWWMDVIFYFATSLLVATVFCYFIFSAKNNFLKDDIKKAEEGLKTVGTEQQKATEKSVVGYRDKINKFTELLKNHDLTSNAFALIKSQTMPNVWFKQFSLDRKNNAVQLSGEADSADALSRQILVFEKSKYIKTIGNLNSSLGSSARVDFNVNISLQDSIFTYLSTK